LRTRLVKPSLFLNEDLARVSIPARYLFVGLWCAADREGRIEDRPRQIKATLYPYDDLDADALLTELVAVGVIRRYEVKGVKVILVVKFKKHQRVHPNEAPSLLPSEPEEVEAETVGTQRLAPLDNQGLPLDNQGLPNCSCSSSYSSSSSEEKNEEKSKNPPIVPPWGDGWEKEHQGLPLEHQGLPTIGDSQEVGEEVCFNLASEQSETDTATGVAGGKPSALLSQNRPVSEEIHPRGQMEDEQAAADASGSVTGAPGHAQPGKRKPPPKTPDGFDAFWAAYPRKVSKGHAIKAWEALAKAGILPAVEVIVEAVKVQARSPAWLKDGGQYIQHPATWLRANGWENETRITEGEKDYGVSGPL